MIFKRHKVELKKHAVIVMVTVSLSKTVLERLKALKKEGIPLLRLETDYGEGDMGQLRTRIDAFLEMIRR